jgi:hypothetical protein
MDLEELHAERQVMSLSWFLHLGGWWRIPKVRATVKRAIEFGSRPTVCSIFIRSEERNRFNGEGDRRDSRAVRSAW